VNLAFREQIDQRRSLDGKPFRSLCYAPFVALWFANRGDVRACCKNSKYPVGNVLQNTIDEIWSGARIKVLRDALKNYNYGPGCEFCKFQTAGGSFENLFTDSFEYLEVLSEAPLWPKKMEFELSNSCNLECIMCSGQFSSAIRAKREKLAPLPRIYSDEILESLRKYLPHLDHASFYGGEPFLITEYERIWDMMIEDDLHIPCHVTTNATLYNKRVEKILEQVPMGITVSLDGTTRSTYESIRINAVFDEVMENARRFHEYTKSRHTCFIFNFCMMRPNWHELADICLMADEWDCDVFINTVLYPPELGIYTQPIEELRKILKGMEAQAPELEKALKRNKHIWFGELSRVRSKCAGT